MSCKFTELVIDCANPRHLADFWSAVLGYRVLDSTDDDSLVEIGAPGAQPTLVFARVPEPKTVKNRLHIDLNATGDADQQSELARLLSLGARHTDVGQREVTWFVLADPEGNEFCLLRRTVT
ncbi:MAG: VOC family protein [Chloroflexota bacterium]|nr:VOC family protein [Chloroflexota bacterium]